MIQLIDDYVLDVDENNYTLMIDKHKIDKKGKPIYEVLGYFTTIEMAIYRASEHMNKRILTTGNHSLIEAMEIIKASNERFIKMLEELKHD